MPDRNSFRTTGRPPFRAEQRGAAIRGTPYRPQRGESTESLYPPDWPAISAAIRARDGYRCQFHRLEPGATRCPAYFPPPFAHYLHVHHVIPLPRGSSDPANLITLCTDCHGRAHNRKFKGPSARAISAAKRW